MYAIVTDKATAEACRNAIDRSFGLPVESVNVGSGAHVQSGDFRRVVTHFSEVIKHRTKDQYAYRIVEANESRLAKIKATAVSVGASGTNEQKLIALIPEKTDLDASWF